MPDPKNLWWCKVDLPDGTSATARKLAHLTMLGELEIETNMLDELPPTWTPFRSTNGDYYRFSFPAGSVIESGQGG